MYPNYKNKHAEPALFSPTDFLKYAKLHDIKLPKKYVLLFQESSEKYIKKAYALKKFNKIKSLDKGNLYISDDVGLLKISGIGSPHVCTIVEELIALGANQFIIIGTAGGLEKTGIYVCNRAIRDEGTSHHYVPRGKYAYPSTDLSKKLENSMKKLGLEYELGTTWTIDAPYRETRAEVIKYRKEGVKTVEMEASALFSVAKYRKVKIAAAFSVSDLLLQEWDPQFKSKSMQSKLNKAIDAAIYCLKK